MQGQLLLTITMAAASAHTVADSPHRMFDAGSDNQAGLTFSPDGATAYWVEWDGEWGSNAASRRTIYVSMLHDGEWSAAEAAPFSGEYSDDDPFVSPDGQWLYFVSERPAGDDDANLDADIWRFNLAGDERLQHLNINSDAAEFSPVVTASGTLYFASGRDGGFGQGDLYRAAIKGGKFAEPENLGRAVNSNTGEWNLWVSASDYDLVFEASSRPGNVSIPGDLYYSWRTPAGWTAAVPLASVNTRGSELLARLHPDGETLYYTTALSGGHAAVVATDWKALREDTRNNYAPTLLVANRSSHDVSFVNLARGEVIAATGTGEGPHLLSNVSDGRVLATGYGEFPQPHGMPVESRPPFVESLNSRITLIDVATQYVLLDATLDNCSKPHASWIVAQQAYVSCEAEQRIAVVDLESGRTTRYFDTRQQGSHVLAFEPETRTLSVSNTESGSVTLIDIDAGDTRVVPLAAGSEGSLAIDGRIWVANATDGSVSIVDPRSASVVQHIEAVCNFPIAFSAEQKDEVWLACFASGELVAIDRESFAIGRRIKLPEPPLNLVTHPVRRLAYVSLPRQNAVAEIDLESGEVLRRIRVGIEPDGLRWEK
jgi:DNA-binding beta-propeller fold protein YncE